MAVKVGGFGIIPFGRSQFGHGFPDIEPRFLSSRPLDKSINVSQDATLKFTTYCFSSWIDVDEPLPGVQVEISEDAGNTFVPAYASGAFVAPYDGVNSKVRRTEGHELTFYIQKTADWPLSTAVMIRYTGVDNYGQVSSKEAPVVWGYV